MKKTLGLMAAAAVACVGSLSSPAMALSEPLIASIDAYLKPIAMSVDARIAACKGGKIGADGECSKTLKVLSGGTGLLKQSLTIQKASGLPKNMVGRFSESYLGEDWDQDVKDSFVYSLTKAAAKGKTTFQKAFLCDDDGKCKYVVIILAKGGRKGAVDVFAMKSSRQFKLAPNVAVVSQTTTDPETGLPSGNKIVFEEQPAEAPNADDVLAYFDKLVYDKLQAELEQPKNPFGIPLFDEAELQDQNEEEEEELERAILKFVHKAYKKCITECTIASMPRAESLTRGSIKAALLRSGHDCAEICEEEQRELTKDAQDSAKSIFEQYTLRNKVKIQMKRRLKRKALEALANPTVGGGKWTYDDVGAGTTARLAVLKRLFGDNN